MADAFSHMLAWSGANLSVFCPLCPFVSAGLLALFAALRLSNAISTHPAILAAAALSLPHALFYTFSMFWAALFIPSFYVFLLATIGSVSSFMKEKEKIDMYAILVLSIAGWSLEAMMAPEITRSVSRAL